MKDILCFTDFSAPANNAVEYAARIAVKTGASVTLVHLMELPRVYENFSTLGLLNDYSHDFAETEQKLIAFSAEVASTWNVPCSYRISTVAMDSAAIEDSDGYVNYDLIVSGTNGADKIYQFYFGSNSYRISKKSLTPTLIIPEGCTFREFGEIVFASSESNPGQLSLSQLRDFMKDFNATLTVLHVSGKEDPASQEAFHSFAHAVDELFGFHGKINFQHIVTRDEALTIESYMHQSNASMLAVHMEKHGYFYNLFHTSIIKKITSYADFPVLVFHK